MSYNSLNKNSFSIEKNWITTEFKSLEEAQNSFEKQWWKILNKKEYDENQEIYLIINAKTKEVSITMLKITKSYWLVDITEKDESKNTITFDKLIQSWTKPILVYINLWCTNVQRYEYDNMYKAIEFYEEVLKDRNWTKWIMRISYITSIDKWTKNIIIFREDRIS